MSSKKKSVGYKQPPEHSRFKKGQSGNPKGRPKGSRNFSTIVAEELNLRIPVKENGKLRRISKGEGMVKQLSARGLRGEYKAIQILFAIWQREEDKQEKRNEAPRYESLIKEDVSILEEYGFALAKDEEK